MTIGLPTNKKMVFLTKCSYEKAIINDKVIPQDYRCRKHMPQNYAGDYCASGLALMVKFHQAVSKSTLNFVFPLELLQKHQSNSFSAAISALALWLVPTGLSHDTVLYNSTFFGNYILELCRRSYKGSL